MNYAMRGNDERRTERCKRTMAEQHSKVSLSILQKAHDRIRLETEGTDPMEEEGMRGWPCVHYIREG